MPHRSRGLNDFHLGALVSPRLPQDLSYFETFSWLTPSPASNSSIAAWVSVFVSMGAQPAETQLSASEDFAGSGRASEIPRGTMSGRHGGPSKLEACRAASENMPPNPRPIPLRPMQFRPDAPSAPCFSRRSEARGSHSRHGLAPCRALPFSLRLPLPLSAC